MRVNVEFLVRAIYSYMHNNRSILNALQSSLEFTDRFRNNLVLDVVAFLNKHKSGLLEKIKHENNEEFVKKVIISEIIVVFLLSYNPNFTDEEIACYSNCGPSFVKKIRSAIKSVSVSEDSKGDYNAEISDNKKGNRVRLVKETELFSNLLQHKASFLKFLEFQYSKRCWDYKDLDFVKDLLSSYLGFLNSKPDFAYSDYSDSVYNFMVKLALALPLIRKHFIFSIRKIYRTLGNEGRPSPSFYDYIKSFPSYIKFESFDNEFFREYMKVNERRAFIIQRERIEQMESVIDERGRYSAESVRISRAKFDLSGLDRLADRSRALANDTLYLLRQYYFYHTTKDLEKKKQYRRNLGNKFYKIIKQSEYPVEKKKRAIEILVGLFTKLKALRSTVPTIMKFMKSYKDIGYSPCAQQIVKSICETFISHLELIKKYYKDLKKWKQTTEYQRGPKPSRPGLPRYIGRKVNGERQGKWKLIYPKQRLQHMKNLESLENALNNNRYTCYMYVPPSHDHLIPRIRVRTKVLSQLLSNGGFVEIIPCGRNYSFNIHYTKTKEQRAREYKLDLNRHEQNPNRAISIDFGVNNFLTIFNNFGARFPIFKGSALKKFNYRINHRIPPLQRGSDIITDVLKQYNSEKDKTLESIINSRIHTYHDGFEKVRTMVLYIFKKVSILSRLDTRGLENKGIVLKCLKSRRFFRTLKNTNWNNFKKFAERDDQRIYKGIFNKVRKIILMKIAPRKKDSLLHKYVRYLQSKRDYRVKILKKILGYSVRDLQDYLESLELRIDELWDKYNRVKRDTINKIAKKLMHYCLYYEVGTITFGYNKGWKTNAVKLKKLTRDLFVSLPFNQMFERVQQEAVYFGITVDHTPEWYTSRCSFIDNELICKKADGEYAGLRRFTQNKVKHNGLFRTRNGGIIHGDVNGAANIGRKQHPELFSHKAIAHNLRLISDPRRPLTNQARQKVTKFIATPPIKFSPSNGVPSEELKRKARLNKSKIKPQRYQMSPKKFLKMTQPAYV